MNAAHNPAMFAEMSKKTNPNKPRERNEDKCRNVKIRNCKSIRLIFKN